MTASSRIFVTHSAHDQTLAEGLVDCLRRGLGLRNDAIFCSSVDRHGIPTGEDFVTYIREKLDGTGIVIPLVTPAYLDSLFCMWELGAAWIQGTPVHPLLIHPVAIGPGTSITNKKALAANLRQELGRFGPDRFPSITD